MQKGGRSASGNSMTPFVPLLPLARHHTSTNTGATAGKYITEENFVRLQGKLGWRCCRQEDVGVQRAVSCGRR